MKKKSSKTKSSKLTKSSKRKSSKVSKISKSSKLKKKLKSITLIHYDFKNPENYSRMNSIVRCNHCDRSANSIREIVHNIDCPIYTSLIPRLRYDKKEIIDTRSELINKGILEKDGRNFRIRRNPSQRRLRNPGGGWIFTGKYADKWDAVRGINMISDDILNKGGEFYAQIRDKKDGSWWVAIISKIRVPYDSELGREGQIAKGDNVINVKKLIRELDDRPKFSGIDALNWIDLRIGYNSRGPEILNRENTWYAANVIERSPGFFNVVDVRYPISGDLFPTGF